MRVGPHLDASRIRQREDSQMRTRALTPSRFVNGEGKGILVDLFSRYSRDNGGGPE